MKKILVIVMVLAVVAAMVIPVAVSADPDDTGATTISGSVPVVIEISTPGTATLPTLSVSAPVSLVSPIKVTVSCTKAGWTLDASSVDGYMKNLSAVALTDPFKIQGGKVSSYTPIGTNQQLLDGTGTVVGVTDTDVNFQQKAEYADATGSYSIIVTFTATAH